MHKEVNDVQVSQIREAISNVVTLGPDFLAKKISAEEMARTMVKAVEEYIKKAKKNDNLQSQSYKTQELLEVLEEIMGCGSGFLVNRCDADCVARTITYLIHEFPNRVSVQ